MRILFVNTDHRIRKQFLEKATKHGPVQVDAVASAREAVVRLAHKSYDCLILDTELADGNGLDLARVLPRRHMILFSNDATKPCVQQAAEETGISTFFIKPAQLPQLCAHLEQTAKQAS